TPRSGLAAPGPRSASATCTSPGPTPENSRPSGSWSPRTARAWRPSRAGRDRAGRARRRGGREQRATPRQPVLVHLLDDHLVPRPRALVAAARLHALPPQVVFALGTGPVRRPHDLLPRVAGDHPEPAGGDLVLDLVQQRHGPGPPPPDGLPGGREQLSQFVPLGQFELAHPEQVGLDVDPPPRPQPVLARPGPDLLVPGHGVEILLRVPCHRGRV